MLFIHICLTQTESDSLDYTFKIDEIDVYALENKNQKTEYARANLHLPKGQERKSVVCGNEHRFSGLFTRTRYWERPQWNKQIIYFNASNRMNEYHSIKTLIFYDHCSVKIWKRISLNIGRNNIFDKNYALNQSEDVTGRMFYTMPAL
ncbi:MAG: hypothetical protein ACTJHT_14730 [Sphingobacterium sp.]|uniref:hypothetical protein n=1 Tax=Sphingobacterium sp. JB170 TaxID=1434842 RepID=UPI00097EE308|nr:hypothetical protein [Sphingobacterium sp. JB170]SJN37178.1 hypothetical protein FM107_09225 [Sphingobacterium sp. JB170]